MQMAAEIAKLVDAAGGRTFFVGGFVRDRVLGRENKDIDIEIHGITVEKLEEILSELGEQTEMGASFI
jgi:tRNA nucleotidyltransferase (CCA-adding enzyme)